MAKYIKKPESFVGFLRECLIGLGIVYIFYRSLLFLGVLGIPYVQFRLQRLNKEQKEAKKWQMNLEFKDGLQGIAAALGAGYAMENAIEESCQDLQVLYGASSLLIPQLEWMRGKLQLNQPVEKVWWQLGERTQIEDIASYAELFATARRSGGDLIQITRTAAERIGERIEVKREIRTMIAGKRMEGNVMTVVPLGMIVYFWICSPGFLDCLYEGISGRFVMSVLFVVYLFASFLNQKICQITC